MSNETQASFQQMRLRAIRFQELTDCHLEMIDGTVSIYSMDGYESVTAYKDGLFQYTKVTNEAVRHGGTQQDFETYAAQWWGHPFPSLLEAQGWIELTPDAKPQGIVLCKVHDPQGIAKQRGIEYVLAELEWAGPHNGWWGGERHPYKFTHYMQFPRP